MVRLGKKKLAPILVRYLGTDALRHPCAGGGNYFFAGRSPVTVDDPTDIAFYRRKAKNNPETWEIVGAKKAEKVKEPEMPKEAKEVK